MRGAEARRNQHLDRLPEKLLAPIPKQSLGLSIDQNDGAGCIDDHHCVRRGLEQAPEPSIPPQTLRHIAHGRRHEHAVVGLDGGKADLGGELAPVLTPSVETQAQAHGPGTRVLEIAHAVLEMGAAQPLGHEDLDRLADELAGRVAEQMLGLGVRQHDTPFAIDDHKGIRRRIQNGAQVLVGYGARHAPCAPCLLSSTIHSSALVRSKSGPASALRPRADATEASAGLRLSVIARVSAERCSEPRRSKWRRRSLHDEEDAPAAAFHLERERHARVAQCGRQLLHGRNGSAVDADDDVSGL